MGKWDRIFRLQPYFESGRFLLPRRPLVKDGVDMVKIFIDEEYDFAPFCVHDDILDMLSRMEDEDLGAIAPDPSVSESLPPIDYGDAEQYPGYGGMLHGGMLQ